MTHRTALKRNTGQQAGSPEWYTPTWLLERIAAFLGPDWYDPCPASFGKPAENGLAASWAGKRVYCNPPYGRPVEAWVIKAMSEPVREAILLVPAYTETRWFAPLYEHTICLVRGRIIFERPDRKVMGHGNQAPHPSALVYRGRRWRKFAQAFADVGPIVRTAYPHKPKQPMLLTA